VNAQYTPGPWTVKFTEAGGMHIEGPEGECLAMGGMEDEPIETDTANAHLIAAAPELLAACELIISRWTPETGRKLEILLGTHAVNIVANAIAKAKGTP
jgi:hypothetical protein